MWRMGRQKRKKEKGKTKKEEGCLTSIFFLITFQFDTGDLHVVGGHGQSGPPIAFDLAYPGQHVALDFLELGLGHLPELELHLRLEKSLAQPRIVVRLGVGSGQDLVEDEPEAADQQGIKDEHGNNLRI